MRPFPLIIVFLALFAVTAAAEEPKTTLTIYSKAEPGAVNADMYRPVPESHGGNRGYNWPIPGYAIVKQEKDVTLAGQRSSIRFSGVAAFIDPTTVSFTSLTDPAGTKVVEQNYQFDLVDQAKLMERFIDMEITVEQFVGNKIETFTGKLLASGGGAVTLQGADGSIHVLRTFNNVIYPQLPGGLITRPTLMWDIYAKKPGPHRARVAYETSGVTWWADYNLVYTDGKDENSGFLDASAWVSIINRTGADYENAKLKLVAGEVSRAPVPQQQMAYKARAMAMEAAPAPAGFAEKEFFEYHLYTLGRPTSIPDNSTKQIELFPAVNNIPVEKTLVYAGIPWQGYYPNYPYTEASFGTAVTSVDVYLRLANTEKNGLGMPLPAGRIRVSKMDKDDGSLEFIGEDVIRHTPRDEKIQVKLGRAFDVVGERKQTNYRVDTTRKWLEESLEIKIRNRKKAPVEVIVQERMFRWVNWTISNASHKWNKEDSRTVHFPLKLGAGEEATVAYTVKYTW